MFQRTKKYELFVNISLELRHGRACFSYDEKFLRSFAKDTFVGGECIKFISRQKETLVEFSHSFVKKFRWHDSIIVQFFFFSRERNSYFVDWQTEDCETRKINFAIKNKKKNEVRRKLSENNKHFKRSSSHESHTGAKKKKEKKEV